MSLLPETIAIQKGLAEFCRTGVEPQLPGTTDKLSHYRRLVYNVIDDTMQNAFPITFQYLDEEVWDELVNDFFSNHACESAQVWKLPYEFYAYAIEKDWDVVYDIPFLNDLMHFEWIEIEVYNMEDMPIHGGMTGKDWLVDIVQFNAETRLLSFTYPVHLFPPDELEDKAGNYYLLAYREAITGEVQFIDLSVWYALLCEQMTQRMVSLADILEEATELFPNMEIGQLQEDSISFLKEMYSKQVVRGLVKA